MRFVTLFPVGENIHLIKDVGQIPYGLQKYYDMETWLVSNYIDEKGAFLTETSGLKIARAGSILGSWKKAGCLFLLLHARKIDWLNLYHCERKSFIWMQIYKFVNPRGKIYLKLDFDLNVCDALDKELKKREFFKKCTEYADLVSAESARVINRVQLYTEKKIELIPNGFMLADGAKPSVPKENVFLTVGRLGTRQKATEVLLEAYAVCAQETDWQLELVGSVEESFRSYIDDFWKRYPALKDRIRFWGEVNDREKLTEIYQRAKVFALPSRWESFGLVLAEAASQGCKLVVTSDVASCDDFVPDERFGRIVEADQIGRLAEAMKELADSDLTPEEELLIKENAYSKFSWKSIIAKLYKCMREVETP